MGRMSSNRTLNPTKSRRVYGTFAPSKMVGIPVRKSTGEIILVGLNRSQRRKLHARKV
jgi:hypothetical protein